MNIFPFLTDAPSQLPSGSSQSPSTPTNGWSFFSDFWNEIVTFFTDNGVSLIIRVLLVLLVIVAGHYLVKLLVYVSRRILLRPRKSGKDIDRGIVTFTTSVVKFILNIVLIFVIFRIISIPIDSLVSIMSAAVLAIGLALQDTIANFTNGIFLLSSHNFSTGDYIEVDGVEGTVAEFNMMSIILLAVDNRRIIVPNSIVAKNKVINFSTEPTRRISIKLGVSYDEDIKLCRSTILSVVAKDKRVIMDPAPVVQLSELGDSAVYLTLKCFTANADYWDTLYDLNENIYAEFKKRSISIPYPQLDVHLRASQKLDQALAEKPELRVKRPSRKEGKS